MSEAPNVVYGRLLESAHISGYSLERALSEFEWLLDDDRWRTVGSGFDDPSEFVASIDLSEFKLSIERRQKLARKLAALDVPQRATAKMLGVGTGTVARDVAAPNGATEGLGSVNGAPNGTADAPNGADAPFATAGGRVAQLAAREHAREVVRSSSETDEWATPQELFDRLDADFRFTLDVCATPENAKCKRFYTREHDGLTRRWKGVCWMNPPYGDAISAWVQKAYESAQLGATVVCLVPARVDTAWWWDFCRYGEIRFLRGRLRFGGADSGAPFPSAVVVFPRTPNVVWWEWQA